ncbi:MAG TPA: hypothetical protein VGI83_01170, partial [Gemmatimonadales bacterium]
DNADYNSDPDLFLDATTNSLVMLNREVRGGVNVIERTTSADGINWTTPIDILEEPNHQLISPAIVTRPGRPTLMWVVDAGNGCANRTSQVVMRRWRGATDLSPDADHHWSKPTVTSLAQPGYVIWHLDVTYVTELQEFWAIYPARDTAEARCTVGNQLFVARSSDGVHWQTFDKPVLTTGVTPWASRTLYRSSMVYDQARERLRVWLSAAANDGGWYLGYAEVPILGTAPAGTEVTALSQDGTRGAGVPPMRPPKTRSILSRMVKDSFP